MNRLTEQFAKADSKPVLREARKMKYESGPMSSSEPLPKSKQFVPLLRKCSGLVSISRTGSSQCQSKIRPDSYSKHGTKKAAPIGKRSGVSEDPSSRTMNLFTVHEKNPDLYESGMMKRVVERRQRREVLTRSELKSAKLDPRCDKTAVVVGGTKWIFIKDGSTTNAEAEMYQPPNTSGHLGKEFDYLNLLVDSSSCSLIQYKKQADERMDRVDSAAAAVGANMSRLNSGKRPGVEQMKAGNLSSATYKQINSKVRGESGFSGAWVQIRV